MAATMKAPAPVLALARRLLQALRGVPASCTLYLTDRCNLACGHCRRSVVGPPAGSEVTLPTVLRLLERYPSLRWFSVAGFGEPTLARDFGAIVEHLVARGRRVGVVTNGLEAAPLLALRGEPESISISLNGHDRESYRERTGVDAFERVTETLQETRRRFARTGVSFILRRDAYRDLDPVLEFCARHRPAFLHLQNYLAYDPDAPAEQAKTITVHDAEIIRFVDERCRGQAFEVVPPVYLDPAPAPVRCLSYEQQLNVDGEGNVGGCLRQIPPSAEYGNLFKDRDPFRSPRMREVRERLRRGLPAHPECRVCFGKMG